MYLRVEFTSLFFDIKEKCASTKEHVNLFVKWSRILKYLNNILTLVKYSNIKSNKAFCCSGIPFSKDVLSKSIKFFCRTFFRDYFLKSGGGEIGKARDIKKPTIQSSYYRTLAEKDQLKVLKLIHKILDAFVNDVIDISDWCRSTFDVSVFLIL